MSTVHDTGLTLTDYATAKGLDRAFLEGLGLTEIFYSGAPAVRIPYRDENGEVRSVRIRRRIDGPDRFAWRKGSKAIPYGLDRLSEARAVQFIILVEGESDCHTLWQHGLPALGLPGAGAWREDRDAPAFDGIEVIYLVREPGTAGERLVQALASSRVASRVRVVTIGAHKDPSGLYLHDREGFALAMQAAMAAAVPISTVIAAARGEENERDAKLCGDLANSPSVLDDFAKSMRAIGVVGEDRNAKVVYLALTSRLLLKPVNIAVKGPSGGGKSHLVHSVLMHFPDEAYVFRTSFSEHTLVYTDEPFKHRFLVVAEAAGAEGDTQQYLIRTLLSEARLEYETVEKLDGVLTTRRISKEGPTGLIVTTTRASLHPENETRLLSLTVSDTREQTRAVMQAIAADRASEHDMSRWQAFQRWLTCGETVVVVPFARTLAGLASPAATRVRRDFSALLSLIKAHTLLHRNRRDRDRDGRVIATTDDYAAVHGLVADLFAQSAAKTVKTIVRETVEVVRRLGSDGMVTNQAIAKSLNIDEAAASRRCREAAGLGYLVNEEDRRGRPAKYKLGASMPDDEAVLPTPNDLDLALATGEGEGGLIPLGQEVNRSIASDQTEDDCTIDRLLGGYAPPPPLPAAEEVEEVF